MFGVDFGKERECLDLEGEILSLSGFFASYFTRARIKLRDDHFFLSFLFKGILFSLTPSISF